MSAVVKASPINGEKVDCSAIMGPFYGLAFEHGVHGFGAVDFSNALATAWQFDKPIPSIRTNEILYNIEEARRMAALIRSLAWRIHFAGPGYKLLICYDEDYSRIVDSPEFAPYRTKTTVRTLSSLHHEVQSLDFESRAIRTLENIHVRWQKRPSPYIPRCYMVGDTHGHIRFQARPTATDIESGITYATPQNEGHYIYDYLKDNGLVREAMKPTDGIELSAKGFQELDRMRQGEKTNSREVFAIRPWNLEDDQLFREVCEVVAGRLTINIGPVWAKEHIERIDERIFRSIRESAAVILYVSSDNFNVGLEAGYALALGKPIVAVRRKPADDAPDWEKKFPFDIATLNCYEYTLDNRKEFEDKLEARLALAIPALKA